ncbi:MAG: bifunctional proline dehydrogenase/L-glutamate gamma-semialdehyde dehydrogenase [Actinobacteria bacterium]|nr:bifunctional proline dehydrogenase/L-glutamate gamma-semialdehyde dehydrogenase [Actinomycetota bacterium]
MTLPPETPIDPATSTPHADATGIAVAGAAELLRASRRDTTRAERRRETRLAEVVADAGLRDLTFALTDEVLRLDDDRRAAKRFAAVVRDLGDTGGAAGLGLVDRVSLRAGALLAPRLPGLVMPLVRRRILAELDGVVLPAEDPAFARHVEGRSGEGFRLNVNVLGEAILSDAEAEARMVQLRERIARPDVDYVSLKISAVCANLDVLAFEHSVGRICERLRDLYRTAEAARPRTFVNLDMEEFRDLPLTIAAMQRVLDEPEFASIHAGIVLQAYLPDSHDACRRLCEWALARFRRSGGTLKIRIVKGANLAMERVESELHGWEQAPYATKVDVDASFKRLIASALDQRWADAVRVGVASHNLFDLAWAMGLPARERIDVEMLEGMAPAQARAVLAAAGDVLLYAPVVRTDDLPASIAYLTRRLDENTSPENFLRSLFTLEPGSPTWDEQRSRFEAAMGAVDGVSTVSRRAQDRGRAADRCGSLDLAVTDRPFENAADTDWTSEANRAWIEAALAAPPSVVVPVLGRVEDIDAVVARAVSSSWATVPPPERQRVLRRAADTMEAERGATLSLMAHEAAKTVAEGDPEVSEAIDFARYYASCIDRFLDRAADDSGSMFEPVGVVVVASPWNFPYAIPAGGVLAALAAGNAVVLKPAPEVRATARLLAEQLWRSGVPADALQYVACPDDEVGRRLVTHPDVGTVVLTGAYETAMRFLDWRPSMRLLAETSGKNAMVITAAADEDAAIKDLVRSAFGHAGQKCSAASLAIVEASVYDDPRFLQRLADAVGSVRVGAATDLATMTGPLIGAPSPQLTRALTTLDAGERWLVEPRRIDERTWTPGVRLGVRPGSWFQRTECFGPVLGVVRADDLDHAIEIQNASAFGLTGGIQSLDDREVDHWLDRVEVGNAYVNRHITGAIVQRQPFGGWKRSSVGCGPKAGGPHYVEAFGAWVRPAEVDLSAVESAFADAWVTDVVTDRDPSGLVCEQNLLRHRPLRRVALVVGEGADPISVAIARIAARVAGVDVIDAPSAAEVDRIRVIGHVDDDTLRGWFAAGFDVDRSEPSVEPTVELRRWAREQAISRTRHRHGRSLD